MKDDRLYARFTLDFPDSPKFIALSVEAKWAYVEMVIYSRRMMTDGFIASAVANARWGASVCLELASNCLDNPSLIEVENGYQIHDFEKHQTTKRDLQDLREKRKAAGQKGGKASAQARAKQVLKQNSSKIKPETETETETEVNKDKKRVVRAKPKRPLPDDWHPIDSHRAKARELSLDLNAESEKFKTFHQSKDNRYADWGKAFHTWLTRAAEYAARQPQQNLSAADRALQRGAERHRQIEDGLLDQPMSWEDVIPRSQIER